MNEVGDNEVEVNKGVFGNVVNDQDIEKSFKVNEECINEDSSDGKGRENDHNNEGDTRLKNDKPTYVQKWSVDMKLDKTDPDKIPLWVKLCDVPSEAWTVKGISALASRLGKSLVMDSVTTKMCKQGNGKVRYVRVLVEVSAKKELTDVTEVVYKNSMGEVHCRKSVKVVYGWKPPTCCDCGVFGHMLRNCHKKEPSKTNVQKENESNEKHMSLHTP
ncbi:RNA-directed DNA polymerase, eukaryota, reverse transcriptase zinc-binding domain protein [Tanacetum coccineum]